MERQEVFLKIREELNNDSPMAWYEPTIGCMEAVSKTGNVQFSVVEGFFNSGQFCNNDGFLLEVLQMYTFATVGMVRDGMEMLKRKGERVNVIPPSSVEARLEVFSRVGLVAKYRYTERRNDSGPKSVAMHVVWSITSMGIKVVTKHREKRVQGYDVLRCLENSVSKMVVLSSSYAASLYAKSVDSCIPTISSSSLLNCPDVKGAYYTAKVALIPSEGCMRTLFFETAFTRDDGYIRPAVRIEKMLQQFRDVIKYIKYKKDSYEGDYDAKIVILVENKKALDEIVDILYTEMPEIFDYAWFSSVPAMRLRDVKLPFLYVSSDSLEREGGKVLFKVGPVTDETFV